MSKALNMKGLNRREYRELTNLLRKTLLYQTPRPIFADQQDEHPAFVDIRFVFEQHQRILMLIGKAGGWVLPAAEREKLLRRHEEKLRRVSGDGIDYDLSDFDYGALVSMYTELEGIDDLKGLRDAVTAELADQQKERDLG